MQWYLSKDLRNWGPRREDAWWGRGFQGLRGNLWAGMCLACWKSSREASVADAEWARQREVGNEVREVRGIRHVRSCWTLQRPGRLAWVGGKSFLSRVMWSDLHFQRVTWAEAVPLPLVSIPSSLHNNGKPSFFSWTQDIWNKDDIFQHRLQVDIAMWLRLANGREAECDVVLQKTMPERQAVCTFWPFSSFLCSSSTAWNADEMAGTLAATLDNEHKGHPYGWVSGELEEAEVPQDLVEQIHNCPHRLPPGIYFASLFLAAQPSHQWYNLSVHCVKNKLPGGQGQTQRQPLFHEWEHRGLRSEWRTLGLCLKVLAFKSRQKPACV